MLLPNALKISWERWRDERFYVCCLNMSMTHTQESQREIAAYARQWFSLKQILSLSMLYSSIVMQTIVLCCITTTVSRCNPTKSLVVWDIYLTMRCCDLYSVRSVILSFLCWCLPDEAHLLLRAARYRHLSTIKSCQPYRVCPDWRSGTGVLKLYFMNVIKCQSVCLTRSSYMFDVSP